MKNAETTKSHQMTKRILKSSILGVSIGLAIGLGAYTFIYAKGGSYLMNDPASCANCHIMQEQYDAWLKSSHRVAATCNDCHTPPGMLAKYLTKASNGFWHSFAFTTGKFHDPIQIKPHNLQVTESACMKCHDEITDAIHAPANGAPVSCVRCHRSVGHLH